MPVLNDVLCFVKSRYVKVPVKQLKSALTDFYTVESLSAAKQRLLDDVEALKEVKLPHIPRRRDGDGRITREVDDLIAIFNLLDERKSIELLPKYVSDDPDNMPSIRLFDGDMKVVMIMLERLEQKVEGYASALSTVTRDVGALRSKVVTLEQFPPLQTVTDINTTVWPRSQAQPVQPGAQPKPGNSRQLDTETNDHTRAETVGRDWATLASTPNIHTNRFAALPSTTDDEGAFETVQSRKSKRQRAKSQQQQQQRSSTVRENTHQQQLRPRRPTVYGKSTAVTNVAAARKLKERKKKAVFCIDNISTDCSSDDIESFVATLQINIVSCHEVKPRRGPNENESDVKDRKAFRLCIFDEDRQRLLNAAMWPDSVIISEWFSKPRQIGQDAPEHSKRRRLSVPDDGATIASEVAAQPTPVAGSQVVEAVANDSVSVSDDTIIAAYHMDHSPTSVVYGV